VSSRKFFRVFLLLLSPWALAAGGGFPSAVDAAKLPDEAAHATIRISPERTAIFFDGFIDDGAVAVAEETLRAGTVNTLYIRSTGGHVNAAIWLGEMVRDAKLTVIVKDYCASSCANYVFTAGRSRVIDGVVMWHGSAEQKDLREFHLCGRQVSSLYGGKMPSIEPERRAQAVEAWNASRRHQAEFFESIGVNEYITRAGQEPVVRPGGFTSDSFTYDVATMDQFGMRDITAEEDYGTAAWCERVNKGAKRTIGCIAVTQEMLEYERARKERGEECQANGTLKIRPAAP